MDDMDGLHEYPLYYCINEKRWLIGHLDTDDVGLTKVCKTCQQRAERVDGIVTLNVEYVQDV